MTAVAIIPARGGSKGIPKKNIRKLAGRPLLHWVLRAASSCQYLDKIYVSTDDPDIGRIAREIPGVEVLDRDPETATDTASTEVVLSDALSRIGACDDIVLIQATSPLLRTVDLDQMFEQRSRSKAISALTVVRQKRFYWQMENNGCVTPVNYDPFKRPRRQEFNGQLVENGAAYLTTRAAWEKTKCRISGSTVAIEMDESSYIELDEIDDWLMVESLISFRLKKRYHALKLFVTDVDGTLTDGGMTYGEFGELSKTFNTRDAAGMKRLQKDCAIELGVITTENSAPVHKRMQKLGFNRYAFGIQDKASVLKGWCRELNIGLDQVAYIGDDFNDLGAIRLCGLSACPADACSEVRDAVDVVLPVAGGRGCVRAFCDIIRNAFREENHA